MGSENAITYERRTPHIIDTTLRDGEQAPGVCFSRQSKLAIAENLDRAGIDELEVGVPAMGAVVQEDIRRIAALNLRCRLSVWCRAHPDDLTAALQCKVGGIHISLPVSPLQLSAMGKDRRWALAQLVNLVPTTHLISLSHLVSRASGMDVGAAQPVVGEHMFTHESGIHCRAMFNDHRTFEPTVFL